jgi:hypothetical protein
VLEVPWATPDRQGAEPSEVSHNQLEIRLVDDFEDPWLGREAQAPSSSPLREVQPLDPISETSSDATDTSGKGALEPRSESDSFELIDPWDERVPRL